MATIASPVLFIVGPTASGKSALAHQLALEHSAAILCADARTIYRGADIGTAKPSPKERAEVQYFGLDIVDLSETFTAHTFKKYAETCIESMRRQKRQLIIVGGTGLYIDALVYDFSFRKQPNQSERQQLNQLSVTDLQRIINERKLTLPINQTNPRHLIRTIESGGERHSRAQKNSNYQLFGLMPSDEVLKLRIVERIETMFQAGFIDEVRNLLTLYPASQVQKAGIGYKFAVQYIEGLCSLREAMTQFQRGDWQYARRQKTWFKRNKDIRWYADAHNAYTHIEQLLKH